MERLLMTSTRTFQTSSKPPMSFSRLSGGHEYLSHQPWRSTKSMDSKATRVRKAKAKMSKAEESRIISNSGVKGKWATITNISGILSLKEEANIRLRAKASSVHNTKAKDHLSFGIGCGKQGHASNRCLWKGRASISPLDAADSEQPPMPLGSGTMNQPHNNHRVEVKIGGFGIQAQ
eukprot:1158675-Amphidinium_carterae.4